MVQNIKGNEKTINSREKDRRFGQMEQNMKEYMRMVKNMDKAHFIFLMAVGIKESL